MRKSLSRFFNKGIRNNSENYYEPENLENESNTNSDNTNSKTLDNENFKREILEKFKSRRSIRKFSSREVSWEILHKIIEGSLNAPAAGNVQNYKIIVITEKKKRYELGKIAFQQYWLADAPVLLVVVRDDYDLKMMYPNEGGIYSIQNTAALIENILLLSHFYDLGACWVEAYDNDVLKQNLNIPIEKRVDAIIPIGYPLENPKIVKDEMITKVYFEIYGNSHRK
jgi:nitroreductase